MPVIGNIGQKDEDKNVLKPIADVSRTTMRRPSTAKGITIFRPIPEIAPDGSIRPMVLASTPAGPDYSAIRVESLVVRTGTDSKFTGITRPSDRPNSEDIEHPFTLLYARLKSRVKKKDFEKVEHLRDQIRDLFDEDARKSLMQRPKEHGLMQGILHTFNGKALDKPLPYQTLALSKTAVQALDALMREAYSRGEDLFSPEGGHFIELYPVKQRGNDMEFFEARLHSKCPLSEKVCKKLWVPWDDLLATHTFDEHVRMAVECFGRELVEAAIPRRIVARSLGEEVSTTPQAERREEPAATTTSKPAPAAPPAAAPSGIDEDALLSIDPSAAAVELEDGDDEDDAPKSSKHDAQPDPQVQTPEDLAAHYAKLLETEDD